MIGYLDSYSPRLYYLAAFREVRFQMPKKLHNSLIEYLVTDLKHQLLAPRGDLAAAIQK